MPVVTRSRLAMCGRGAIVVGLLLVAGRAVAATQTFAPSGDTFINGGDPNNNNGGSATLFTGTDGHGGTMRGLVRFALPAALQSRVTVTSAELTLTVAALGDGTAGAPATESLQAVTQAWIQGNGVGSVSSTFTVGQPCTGAIVGATWNETNCLTGTVWTSAGGAVVSAVSALASTSGVPVGGVVTFNGVGLAPDVQGWIDTPGNNHGWRVTSSTEGAAGQAQRFDALEAGTSAPSLAVTYSCKAGFDAVGLQCTTCTAAANVSCAVAQGNSCVDPGAPATTYSCSCGAGFVLGTAPGGGAACLRSAPTVPAAGALATALLVVLLGASGLAALARARRP